MAEVYYYLPVKEVDNAVECGLKLSKWFDREICINGELKKCLSALLNPRDDIEKYKSQGYKCVKLELPSTYCFVADKYLYLVGQNYPEIMELYANSIIPVEEYIFGSYRIPECLVTTTVLAGQISVLNKYLDSPVLFNKSEELYVNNIIEAYREEYDDFNEVMLYYFYCKLAENKKIDKIEDMEKKIAVFLDKQRNKTVALKIPEINRY